MIAGAEQLEKSSSWALKLRDYHQLVKTRLTLSVVISAVLGFWLGAGDATSFMLMWPLAIGGFLVVAASNGLNQVIERNFDKLMERTNNRPVATGRMKVAEASVFSLLSGVVGIYILGSYLNPLSGLLGFIALLSYAFVYTPLKRFTPFAVFVGAIPGAIPPLLGWVAASGSIGMGGIVLFMIQFFWQFPHFWSIAWLLDEDYQRAGYRLLPSRNGKNKTSAMFTIWYSFILVPLGVVPYFIGISGIVSAAIAIVSGLVLTWYAIRLFQSCENREAKRLMFISIIYNTLVLLAFCLDKV
jgi:protoheme IX farnesyltransferase